jgi:hypothetical protein
MRQDVELEALIGQRVRIAKARMALEGILKGRSFVGTIADPRSPGDCRWILDTGAAEHHFASDDG